MKSVIDTKDPKEVAKFEAMADEWWDPNGKFKPLHMLNPCRLDYIVSQIALEFERDLKSQDAFKGLEILDIGCGGGLLCEPMARLGATVVGVDAAERNIPVAKAHANHSKSPTQSQINSMITSERIIDVENILQNLADSISNEILVSITTLTK